MLKMRLQRVGRKNDPSYRVVVTDSRTGPKSNKHVAILGSYNPKMDHVQIDGEEAKNWITKGVQVSPTVHNILVGQKIIEGKKVNVLPKKAPIVSDQPEEEAAPAPAKAEETATEESPAEAPSEETPAEAEKPAEEVKEEPVEETKDAAEPKEEAPVEETTPEAEPETEAEEDTEKKEG